jgi:WD40 repeat protein/TPR repeat protein
MNYLLLLVNSAGEATTSPLVIRELREFPGGQGLSVHFRPVRNDLLFESAKVGGALAYRILSGEGVVRSQLWVEYELPGPHVNVTGRSSDLLFALALITAKWKKAGRQYPAIAATGVLDSESASLTNEGTSAVQGVKHTVEKVAAAVSTLVSEPEAVVFYPAAASESVANWSATTPIPAHIQLYPVASLEDALSVLGISLEKVYLGNPFRGLEFFDYQHRAIFFGRDTEVTEVLAQLLRREAGESPGLLVEGASGSGKSSFLRAGVLPALVHPGSQPTDIEQALALRPVRDTVKKAIWRAGLLPSNADEEKFARSILDCWRNLPELADSLSDLEQVTLAKLAEQRRRHWPLNQRFVWLLDQLEELFALRLPEHLLDIFGKFLIDLQSDGVWTLASIRADAVPLLKQIASLREGFGSNEGQYYLATISATALDDVINRPARAANLSFGMGPSARRLDQILREDAYKDRENALPLLQFSLFELYQRRSERELTYAAYEQLGGLSGSVATTAEAVLKAEAVDDRVISCVFRSLVSVDELGAASRRYAPIAEIAQDAAQNRLLVRLVEARLCVTDQREDRAVVAFAHEALLRTWPALVAWLQREAGLLQTRELAQREARLWQQHGQSDDWLASSDKLLAFEQLNTAGIPLSMPIGTFIERSQRRVRRTTRIKHAAVSLIALLAIVATGAGWIASRKQHEAELQTQETLKAQVQLLTHAAEQRLKDSDVSGAQNIVLDVLTNPAFPQSNATAAINVFQETRAADVQLAVLSGHIDRIRTAAYSPDGFRIVTASWDKTARIWDALTGVQLAILAGHGDTVTSAAYSPDGKRIVTASKDKTARIWDALTGVQLVVLSGHRSTVVSAAYSPDGTRIVTASYDKSVRIWDSRSGSLTAVIAGHSEPVFSAAYSPNGTRIVTASWDKTARIWDARTGAQLILMSGHDDQINSAAYSPDGTHVVTASQDKTARIWNAQTGVQQAVLSGHSNFVYSAAYSPDGTHIVTASYDKTARIWDAQGGVAVAVLSGHDDQVNSAVYSPDGTQIVTSSLDKTARTWSARPSGQETVLHGHGVPVITAGYSPDGARVVTASRDKTARVWDARTGTQLIVLSGHGGIVYSAVFSPDGTRIATASTDMTARVWDASSGAQLEVLSGHTNEVTHAAYSPDGARIVTASSDKTARIWDAHTAAPLGVLSGHSGVVVFAAYSPDGTRIVTASLDDTARVWDAHSASQLLVLSGHTQLVSSAEYSPDGARIVTASTDRSARIWDAVTGSPLHVLAGHRDEVNTAAYSPNGLRIVTASTDKTSRIWDSATGTPIAVLSGHFAAINSAIFSPDGTHIVTAADDRTARIWDARDVAKLEAQILWGEAAEADSLSNDDRAQLGLPSDPRIRIWATRAETCDQSAAAFYDPARLAPGNSQSEINVDIAGPACSATLENAEHTTRSDYQMGRVLLAKHDWKGAKQQFEAAASGGYRAASIDLANLLVDDSAGMLDPLHAVSLFEEAWRNKVPIAAFDLGHLYESGPSTVTVGTQLKPQPDLAKAWSWYQKGADAGEPNALARFAERDERNALDETDQPKRNALLLRAFSYYAAAAERAKNEAWPDDAWRHWRYRRATLARLLAREGLMQQVADAYASVLSISPATKSL